MHAPGEGGRGLAEFSVADDRVAPVDVLRLVAGELHGDAPGNAGVLESPDGRPAQVVKDAPRTPRLVTRRRPGLATVPDGAALVVKEPAG
jgi:hypothetical protein